MIRFDEESVKRKMEEGNPLVSIITVVYNGAGTIEQTIESVKGQSYKNIEYIIVDGDSTDGTQQIVNKHSDFISYFISEKDNGIYDAMNKGILHAKGDIIGIINSDDWYALAAVKNAVRFFEENDVDLVYGNIQAVDYQGKKIEWVKVPLEAMWYRMAVPHPSVFIKKVIYDRYGLFDLKYKLSADYELILRLYSSGVRFGYIDEIMVFFRAGGASQIYGDIGIRESCEIACKYIDRCKNNSGAHLMLEKMKRWLEFEDAASQNPAFLPDLLKRYFKTDLNRVILFGIGKWGRKCYGFFEKTGFEMEMFWDNHPGGIKSLYGKAVRKPEKTDGEGKYILVAVKEAQKIEEQLNSMGIVNYVTLEALLDLYFKERGNGFEKLPDYVFPGQQCDIRRRGQYAAAAGRLDEAYTAGGMRGGL